MVGFSYWKNMKENSLFVSLVDLLVSMTEAILQAPAPKLPDQLLKINCSQSDRIYPQSVSTPDSLSYTGEHGQQNQRLVPLLPSS
jgi:hypothetical protein